MATVMITKSKAWGVVAILILLIIILALYGAGKELMNPSKDGEIKKMTEVLSVAVDKITATNKTLDGVDGAVKKFPLQLKEAISDHERRLHSGKAVTHRRAKSVKPPTKMVAEVRPQRIETVVVDEVAIASRMIVACDKLGGTLITKDGNVVCDPRKVAQPQPVVQVAPQPAPLQEGAECDAGKGRPGVLKVVDGVSRCVWEEVKASPARAVVYSEQARFSAPPPRSYPPEQRYYPPVQQAESSSGSWVPWVIAGVVTAAIIYKNNRRATTLPPVAIRGGPANPAPGGPPVAGGPVGPIP